VKYVAQKVISKNQQLN